MTDPGTAEQVFDIAMQIQIRERKYLEVNFAPDHVRILLPPKRLMATSGTMAMSKITAALSEMEQDHLIAAEQRGGMWTTPEGNRILAGLLAGKYRKDTEGILGPVVFETVLNRLTSSYVGESHG